MASEGQDELKQYIEETVVRLDTVAPDALFVVKSTKKGVEVCQAHGYKIDCVGSICIAHIISRQYKPLATNKNNRIHVCKAHEEYFNTAGLEEWFIYIRDYHGEKFQWIQDRCKQIIKECKMVLELVKK